MFSYPDKIVYSTEKLVVFSDMHNNSLFYYQFLQPQIAKNEDGLAFRFIMYRTMEELNGGYLSLDIEIPIDQVELDKAKQSLGKPDLEFRPLPIRDTGTVKCNFIAYVNNKNSIKYSISNSVQSMSSASCYGNNRTCFAFPLDKNSASLFNKCLEGDFLPIGITYNLSYYFEKPTYYFKATVDWARTFKYFESTFSVGLIVFSMDISNVYSKLINNKYIVIEKITDNTDEQTSQNRESFEQEIINFLCKNFFEPVAIPDFNEKPILGYSYKKVNIQDIQKKFAAISVAESKVLENSLYPQCFLQNILPKNLSPYVSKLDLYDSFFKSRSVIILTNANFELDQIDYIQVVVKYLDKPMKTVVLNKDHTFDDKTSWTYSYGKNGEKINNLTYSFTVFLKNKKAYINWLSKASSDLLQTQEDIIVINPRSLYSVKQIRFFVPSKLIWSKYECIVISACWEDGSSHMLDFQNIMTINKPHCEWFSIKMNPCTNIYKYKVSYKSIEGTYVESKFYISSQNEIIIQDYE